MNEVKTTVQKASKLFTIGQNFAFFKRTSKELNIKTLRPKLFSETRMANYAGKTHTAVNTKKNINTNT